jgi:Fur family ferric uptake transcriptional regulator
VHRIEALVSARHGFRPTRHKLEIYGLCQECTAAGVEVTPEGLTCPIETV